MITCDYYYFQQQQKKINDREKFSKYLLKKFFLTGLQKKKLKLLQFYLIKN